MAARTPKKPKATEEQPSEQTPEQSVEPSAEPESPETDADPKPRPRLFRKPLVITVTAALAAVVLGVTGWLVYTNVKAAQELAAAKDAYESSLAALVAAQTSADAAVKEHTEATSELFDQLAVADVLTEQLGTGSEPLVAAGETTLASHTLLEARLDAKPKASAGSLPENPTVADYDSLREKVDALAKLWVSHTKSVEGATKTLASSSTKLTEAWQAQSDTAPGTAESVNAGNPNASQEARDAVTAAALAITELENPLDESAPELWKALSDAADAASAQEQAYQAQKAAEEEAARQAARNSGGSSGNSGNSGGGNPGGSGGTGNTLGGLAALLASELGLSPSQVNCYFGGIGIHCDYPGGWKEFGI